MNHLSLWSRPLGTPPPTEVCIIPVTSWAGCVSRDVMHRSTYNVSSYLSSSFFQDLPAPSNKDGSSWLPLPSLLSFWPPWSLQWHLLAGVLKRVAGVAHTYIPSHAVLCRPWGTCLCGNHHSVVASETVCYQH